MKKVVRQTNYEGRRMFKRPKINGKKKKKTGGWNENTCILPEEHIKNEGKHSIKQTKMETHKKKQNT